MIKRPNIMPVVASDVLGGLINADAPASAPADNIHFYTSGEGNDRIVDSGGTDTLVFNDINWGQIVLGVGSLKLTLPDAPQEVPLGDGSELHLDDFDPDNPYAAGGIVAANRLGVCAGNADGWRMSA